MEKRYRHVVLLFVFVLVLVPLGFRRYLARAPTFDGVTTLSHVHAAVMLTWCTMLIVQPVAIRARRWALHRALGWLSFGLVPVAFVTMLAMTRQGIVTAAPGEAQIAARDDAFLPFAHAFIFVAFYGLAMRHRRRTPLHMRYLIVSSLTLLGPTIGRLNMSWDGRELDAVNVSLFVMEGILVALALFDRSDGARARPYVIGLVCFVPVHLGVYTFAHTAAWRAFAGSLNALAESLLSSRTLP